MGVHDLSSELCAMVHFLQVSMTHVPHSVRSILHLPAALTSLHCPNVRAGSEPMSDAVVFEPIPYRSALRENCTHIIAVRTRAGETESKRVGEMMRVRVRIRVRGRERVRGRVQTRIQLAQTRVHTAGYT